MDFFGDVFGSIKDGVVGAFNTAAGLGSQVVGGVVGLGSQVIGGVSGLGNNLINQTGNLGNGLVNTAGGLAGKGLDTVGGIGNKLTDFLTSPMLLIGVGIVAVIVLPKLLDSGGGNYRDRG